MEEKIVGKYGLENWRTILFYKVKEKIKKESLKKMAKKVLRIPVQLAGIFGFWMCGATGYHLIEVGFDTWMYVGMVAGALLGIVSGIAIQYLYTE